MLNENVSCHDMTLLNHIHSTRSKPSLSLFVLVMQSSRRWSLVLMASFLLSFPMTVFPSSSCINAHTNSNPFHINSATQICVVNSKTYKVVSHEKLSFAFVRCSADVLDQRLNVLLHINFAYGLLDLFVTLLAKPLGKCKSTSKTDLKVSLIASRNAKIRHHC